MWLAVRTSTFQPTTAVTAGVAGWKPQVSPAAPSTVVCGTVLSDSAAGAVVLDATRQLPLLSGEPQRLL